MSGERDKRLLYTTLTRHIVVLLRNHVVHQIGLSTLQIFEPVHPSSPCPLFSPNSSQLVSHTPHVHQTSKKKLNLALLNR